MQGLSLSIETLDPGLRINLGVKGAAISYSLHGSSLFRFSL